MWRPATGHSGATLDVISILNVTLSKAIYHLLAAVPGATFTLQPYSNIAKRRGQPDLICGSLRPLFIPPLHNLLSQWVVKLKDTLTNIMGLSGPVKAVCVFTCTADVCSLVLPLALN